MNTLTCCQDHILSENIWFVWSETSYSGDERRCYRCGTNERILKIELLSQWKLEAEFRNICSSTAGRRLQILKLNIGVGKHNLCHKSLALKPAVCGSEVHLSWEEETPQFGSRKFPHSVCLQSHCGACGRRQASGRATLYTRHQTIRLTAGLTCACYILPLLFNSTATNLGGKYHQQFLSPTLGKQSTNNKNSTSYNYAKLAKLEGI